MSFVTTYFLHSVRYSRYCFAKTKVAEISTDFSTKNFWRKFLLTFNDPSKYFNGYVGSFNKTVAVRPVTHGDWQKFTKAFHFRSFLTSTTARTLIDWTLAGSIGDIDARESLSPAKWRSVTSNNGHLASRDRPVTTQVIAYHNNAGWTAKKQRDFFNHNYIIYMIYWPQFEILSLSHSALILQYNTVMIRSKDRNRTSNFAKW